MDVGIGNAAEVNVVVDPVGSRCQKLFQDFLEDYREGGQELKYLKPSLELVKPERNTLVVSMKDVEQFNTNLAQSIHDDYYRLYPYLCAALKNYIKDRSDEDVTSGKRIHAMPTYNRSKIVIFVSNSRQISLTFQTHSICRLRCGQGVFCGFQ